MFGMGLALTGADFKEVARRPREVVIDVPARFVPMPAIVFVLTPTIPMSREIAAGVILVGRRPGGTAGNVTTHLSRGDTALGVTLTSIRALIAPVVTPALVWVFAHRHLPVDPWAMFVGIIQAILVPPALGGVTRRFLPALTDKLVPAPPLVGVIGIILMVAGVVAANQPKIAESGLLIVPPDVVLLHNGFGPLPGCLAAWGTGMGVPRRKAVAIEVDMRNSGLGAPPAPTHFFSPAAVPSAVFSVWHNISGAPAAMWFRRFD